MVTLAADLVLTFLATAIGLSLTAASVRGDAIAIGAVVAAILVMAGSLFLGGWVTTQLSVGENTREAVIYGVLMWAVVTAASLMMVGAGLRTGYMALVGTTIGGPAELAGAAAELGRPGPRRRGEPAEDRRREAGR